MQPIWGNFYIYGVYRHIFVYVAPFLNYEELYNLSLSCKDLNEIIYPFLVKKCMMIRKICTQSFFRNLRFLRTGEIDDKDTENFFDVVHDYIKFTKYPYCKKLKFECFDDE